MFFKKHKISILNSKWEEIKRNIKIDVIPRRDEFIYLDDQYYEVLNIVHTLDEKQDIFVIINELAVDPKK